VVARQAELHCGLDGRRKQERNLNTKRTKRTKTKGKLRLAVDRSRLDYMDNSLRDLRRFHFLLRALCALRVLNSCSLAFGNPPPNRVGVS
jgi:hypothetical protein